MEDDELPHEFRIVQWEDGDCGVLKVYLKDGKPWSYDDQWNAYGDLAPDRGSLHTGLLQVIAAYGQAMGLPTLNEATDFPGEERYSFAGLLTKISREAP
jgi:hypothetical protein